MAEAFPVEYLDPRDLMPHPSNWRTHPEAQKGALGESIAEHGWLSAPIWNKRTNHILDGHARVELALATEERLIPVRVVDVSERQEKRILASYDRIGELRERDDAALTALLLSLSEEGPLPAGWSDSDLDELLATTVQPGGLLPGVDPDVEFYSPEPVIEAARRVMGQIDLDPASCALANERVGARRYFTMEQDGLLQEWAGRVWLNPPFFAGSYERWFNKLCTEHRSGRVAESCLLMPVSDGRWFHALLQYPVCFLFERQAFLTPEGEMKEPVRYGCVVSYQGERPERFYTEFDGLGTTLARATGQTAERLD